MIKCDYSVLQMFLYKLSLIVCIFNLAKYSLLILQQTYIIMWYKIKIYNIKATIYAPLGILVYLILEMYIWFLIWDVFVIMYRFNHKQF